MDYKVCVLAGGFGTRIQPLSQYVPKPMLPLCGNPILERVLMWMKSSGASDFTFILFFQPDVIQNYFRDGQDFGVKIDYIVPSRDYSTAGAVKQAESFLRDVEDIWIVSGDLLSNFPIKDMYDFHKKNSSLFTVGLVSVPDPSPFGVVLTGKDGRIKKFLEKPSWGEVFSDLINAGIYIMKREVLNLIPPEEPFDFSQNLFPKLLSENKPIFGFKGEKSFDGGSIYWRDIGDTDSYIQANIDIFDGKIVVPIEGNLISKDGAKSWFGKDVSIDGDLNFSGTVVIGDNVKIEKDVFLENCFIGPNSSISQGARISNSVVWNDVVIGENSKIYRSCVASFSRISKSVILEANSVVGSFSVLGDGVTVREGVKIWPNKFIESYVVASINVVWGEKRKGVLFEEGKISGLSNLEFTSEFAAKIGASFGSMLTKGSSILSARDSTPHARMLRRAFMSGVLSSGVNVKDMKSTPVPVMRYKLHTFGEVAGVFFRASETNPEVAEAYFFGKEGSIITPSQERTIERLFFREDFRRARVDEVGRISEISGVSEFYKEGILRNIKKNIINKKHWKIVIDFGYGITSNVLLDVLSSLDCEIVNLNAQPSVIPQRGSPELVSKVVKATSSDMGVIFDSVGEKVIFVDDRGDILSGYRSMSVLCYAFSLSYQSGSIYIPVSSPSFISETLSDVGVKVILIKEGIRSVEESSKNSDAILCASWEGFYVIPEIHPVADSIAALIKTIEVLSELNAKLSDISSELPPPAVVSTKIMCSNEKKGYVIRKMADSVSGKETLFIDGVKLFLDGGWVLILPHKFEPAIILFADGRTVKHSHRILDEYKRKVSKWIEEK